VESKKLTELARMGSDKHLQEDFQKAIQEAYNQGITAREKILARSAKFIDQDGKEIKLSEGIDEVYIMGITTENYPSLTHQSYVMLDKKR
jgi:N-acetylglucosamine kinase-like BadF-type ATPase